MTAALIILCMLLYMFLMILLADNMQLRARKFTYASKQATACAVCGELKHTPLRNDTMGGYVCLTCIDLELARLQRKQVRLSADEIPVIGDGLDDDDYMVEGCVFPGQCCMPGPHYRHECHTPDMIEDQHNHGSPRQEPA